MASPRLPVCMATRVLGVPCTWLVLNVVFIYGKEADREVRGTSSIRPAIGGGLEARAAVLSAHLTHGAHMQQPLCFGRLCLHHTMLPVGLQATTSVCVSSSLSSTLEGGVSASDEMSAASARAALASKPSTTPLSTTCDAA